MTINKRALRVFAAIGAALFAAGFAMESRAEVTRCKMEFGQWVCRTTNWSDD